MSGGFIMFLAMVGLILSALFIVGVAAALVFNLLGLFWGVAFFVLLTCLYGGSIAWAWRDARLRGKPGWAAALLVAAGFWPMGLLLWILFRPEKKSPSLPTNSETHSPHLPPVIN